jgi:hypothetical protein
MKVLLISLGVLAIAFLVFQLFSLRGNKNIETYPYTVLKEYDRFEIRKYEASLFTSVNLGTDQYGQAANRGFSILAGYIFGGNKSNQKIAMTSPVAMTLEDSMTMMFMVPRSISKDKLPEPNQNRIEFREEPEKVVAAIRFGGWASTRRIEKFRSRLTTALQAEGLSNTGRFYYLGYNPPYEVFGRKNEIIAELKDSP